MPWTKKLLYLLLGYALAFALVSSVPSFIHRRAFDEAFSAWRSNPSPQNTSALRIEQHKNELIHLQESAIGALVLVMVVAGIYGGIQMGKHYFVSERHPQAPR